LIKLQQRTYPSPSLGDPALDVPEEPCAGTDRQSSSRVGRFAYAEVERSPKVGLLQLKPLEHLALPGTPPVVIGLSGDPNAPAGVTPADHRLLARLPQPLQSVAAHSFQEPEAGLLAHGFAHDERPLDQPDKRVNHSLPLQQAVCGHLHSGIQVTAAGENRKAPKKHALRLWEHLIAPVQRCSHRLVSGRPSGSDLWQVELAFQPLLDLENGQYAELRGGQLDGKREAVQTPA